MYVLIYFWLCWILGCVGFSLVAASGLLSSFCVRLLIAVASLVAEHGLQDTWAHWLWLLGSRALAQWLCCMTLVAPWHVGSSQTSY